MCHGQKERETESAVGKFQPANDGVPLSLRCTRKTGDLMFGVKVFMAMKILQTATGPTGTGTSRVHVETSVVSWLVFRAR